MCRLCLVYQRGKGYYIFIVQPLRTQNKQTFEFRALNIHSQLFYYYCFISSLFLSFFPFVFLCNYLNFPPFNPNLFTIYLLISDFLFGVSVLTVHRIVFHLLTQIHSGLDKERAG